MPAFRWSADPDEIQEWLENEEQTIHDSFSSSIMEFLSDQQLTEIEMPEGESSGISHEEEKSNNLPILPLRGLVMYPQTAVPLTIGQPRSIKLVDDVVLGEKMIGLVTSRKPEIENPGPEDLYEIGTVAIIHKMFRTPDGTIRVLVQGTHRFRMGKITQTEPYLRAEAIPAPETTDTNIEIEALARNAREQFAHIAELLSSIPRELVASVQTIDDPLQTVYAIANFQRMELSDAQDILELDSVAEKLHKLVGILTRESEVLELGQKIQNEARSEIEKMQREYFLREQAKAIQRELGEKDDQAADVEMFRQKIDEAGMPEEARLQADRELERLSRIPIASAEYGVIRTYLEWLVSIPWSKTTPDNLDIAHARVVLNQDHYGLKDIKERILEFLAVRKLRSERSNPEPDSTQETSRPERHGVILCFIGPPGVGKTSLGQSIARAMNRKFVRFSLGGVRDEAEIRGHRRTYIGAMPGRILQAIRRMETRNPVFMLDEIDKLASDFRGDPASALLEVLDPEQNHDFRDNYLEVGFDLSQVMFITTGNSLETIPTPLLDRMELIQLSRYTENEKVQIARRYLIPRQLKENGLLPEEADITPEALQVIIRSYTRESGVRNLERQIGSLFRKVVTRIAENKPRKEPIKPEELNEMLGRPKFHSSDEMAHRTALPGVATGLAWTPLGGEVLFIEAMKMRGGKNFTITGSIGNVMQESARAALSLARAHAEDLDVDPDFYDKFDIHLHVPAGATPKDGPSAGITMYVALVSLLSERKVRRNTGMTGEISLSGQILPVGGIKEKVLAAHRAGLKRIILPKRNMEDLEDVPAEVRRKIKFFPVETVEEALPEALEIRKTGRPRVKKEALDG